MPESTPDTPLTIPLVQEQLGNIARVLREVYPLSQEAQSLLGALLEELSDALADATMPPQRLAHLTETTAHVVEAIHHQKDQHVVSGLVDRLEKAVVDVETHYPTLGGLGRQLLDTLSNLGI